MAPSNGSKARGPGAAPKPVVPAIPLPYVKRQQQAAAAAAAKNAAKSPALVEQTETKLTNGHKREHSAESVADTVASSALSDEGTMQRGVQAGLQGIDTEAKTNGHDSSGTYSALRIAQTYHFSHNLFPTAASVSEPTSSTDDTQETPKSNTTPDRLDQPTTEQKFVNHDHAEEPSPNLSVDAEDKPNGVAAADEMKHHLGELTKLSETGLNTHRRFIADHHQPAKPAAPRQSQPVSPNRYQMPPPFQPANRAMNMAPLNANGDVLRAPRLPMLNGPPHMHQPHPSNGSVHFGAFHDSTSSSPAPPLSGGIAPPPGMPVPDARNPYMAPTGNGFPPMMPYGPDMMPPVSTYDSFSRPAMSYGPMDSFPSYGNNFGPSVAHSYRDSQASTLAEENAIYPQFPPGPVRNGVPGRGDDSQSPNHTRMFSGPDFSRPMPNPGPPPHMMSQVDDADDLINYIQHFFGNPELSDCTLELRYIDDRAPPVRIPGHRIILARSSELRAQVARLNPAAGPSQVLPILTKNRWVRSDSFYIAVQRLYGMPLFQIPPGFKHSDTADAASMADRFDFALSYAAAGLLLGWDPVIRRGCEVAIHLLNWQTMERALEFALEEHCDEGTHDKFKYGEGCRAILNAVVNYIIHNLPPNFTIDSSLPEPTQYARLPPHPSQARSSVEQQQQQPSSPSIARGTSVSLGKGRRSQQITGIQFGDLSLGEGKNSAASETPKASQQARPVLHKILSSVLVNLPFSQLKMALESAGSVAGNNWANAEYRYRIIQDAVAEREARRLSALEAVKAGLVEGSESILKQLSSPEPRYCDQWAVLGWQEEINPFANPNRPTLGRQWVPLAGPQNGHRAEYP